MPSTAIRSLSYDEVTSTLFVTFVDGDLYAYFEVPAKLYDAFRSARSKGGFFARRVRPHFRYQKVEEGNPPPPSSRPERSAEPGPSNSRAGRPLGPG